MRERRREREVRRTTRCMMRRACLWAGGWRGEKGGVRGRYVGPPTRVNKNDNEGENGTGLET